MVRQRIAFELNGLDVGVAETQGCRHAMHTIHHGSVSRQYDRIGEIHLVHQYHVEDEAPPSQYLLIPRERRIKLTHVLEGDSSAWQGSGERDEPINVPREQTSR